MPYLSHKSFLLGLALLPAAAPIAAPASPSATHTLFADQAATNWSQECYPIGNGRLGAMSFGGVIKEIVQFNEQSLWSGDNNWNGDFQTGDHGFGNYRNFGDLTIDWRQPDGMAAAPNTPTDYRRELDLATGIHTTSFTRNGAKFTRESLASHPDRVLVFHYTADKPGSLSGRITLKSAQGAATSASANSLRFASALPNTLRHAAELRLIPGGGKTRVEGDALVFEACHELTLLLDARTNYKPDIRSGWRTGTAPAPLLDAAAKMDFATLRKVHLADFTPFMTRAQVNLGDTSADAAALPTAERLKRYAANGADPDLEEMIFTRQAVQGPCPGEWRIARGDTGTAVIASLT